MLWAYFIIVVISFFDLDVIYKNVIVGNIFFFEEIFIFIKFLGCKSFINNKYFFVYSCDMVTEVLYLGFISFSLIFFNILCIFIMGIIFFKVKNYFKNYIMIFFSILCMFIFGIIFIKVIF